VLARGRTCQVCGGSLCGNSPLGAHHLVGKDLGGDDVLENLALLGGTGTTKCHGAVQELERVACAMLRRNLDDEQVAYIVSRKSEYFLDRYYPETP
jgi:hypothetical protein